MSRKEPQKFKHFLLFITFSRNSLGVSSRLKCIEPFVVIPSDFMIHSYIYPLCNSTILLIAQISVFSVLTVWKKMAEWGISTANFQNDSNIQYYITCLPRPWKDKHFYSSLLAETWTALICEATAFCSCFLLDQNLQVLGTIVQVLCSFKNTDVPQFSLWSLSSSKSWKQKICHFSFVCDDLNAPFFSFFFDSNLLTSTS